ncbi:MAG: amino acid--[acyl-carrier-protein] ligase [Gemmatimonadota bacterium]
MTAVGPDVEVARRAFLDDLIGRRLLVPMGVAGVFGRGEEFEDTVGRLDQLVTELGRIDGATVIRFPPVINRTEFNRSGYLKSFPHLAGSVHSFAGTEKAHRDLVQTVEAGGDWAHGLPSTDVVLTPAACYPIYPTLAEHLPAGGRVMDVLSFCFRHEPSDDPARMQSFRMREHVRIGTPEQVSVWRNAWFDRAQTYIDRLVLDARFEVANDPFFGRGGKILAQSQRDSQLKFEVVTPIVSAEQPTAVISLNYHQQHFGTIYGIISDDNAPAHTACIGFGLERLTLALYKQHGFGRGAWPAATREALGL